MLLLCLTILIKSWMHIFGNLFLLVIHSSSSGKISIGLFGNVQFTNAASFFIVKQPMLLLSYARLIYQRCDVCDTMSFGNCATEQAFYVELPNDIFFLDTSDSKKVAWMKWGWMMKMIKIWLLDEAPSHVSYRDVRPVVLYWIFLLLIEMPSPWLRSPVCPQTQTFIIWKASG